MRGFFLLVLLTNLLFLGWQSWSPQQTVVANGAAVSVETTQALRLLSELETDQMPGPHRITSRDTAQDGGVLRNEERHQDAVVVPSVPGSGVSHPAEGGVSCYRSGQFASLADAKAMQERLAQLGIADSKRLTVDTRTSNYWVMLMPYENREKANEAAAMLSAKRVKDFFVVRTGQYENAISLGVFSTQERAELRFAEISALKLRMRKPRIEQLDLSAKRLVVTLQVAADGEPEGFARLLQGSDPSRLEKIACE